MDRDDPAYKGQSGYNRALLKVYDRLIIGRVGPFVWRVRGPEMLDNYRRNIRDGHLDVGPGTGWFLTRSGLPDGARITIMDPNTTVLEFVKPKLARFQVDAVEADVCKPLPMTGPFQSAAINLVLHCLPQPQSRKAAAIANMAAVLAPDGVLFGATVLGEDGPQTRLSRQVLRVFNRQGGFDNLEDSPAAVRAMLEASFRQVRIDIVGSVAVFEAREPIRASV
jgi:SAM-dependent methyltransferase